MRVYEGIVEEHLDEIGFLAAARRKLLFSHEIGERKLREHESRIEAHLDGLRWAADEARDAIEERFQSEEPWEVFAAAIAWLEVARPDGPALIARLDSVPDEARPSWVEALRWSERPLPEPERATNDGTRAILVAVTPWRGVKAGAAIAAMAASDDAPVRRAAARALGLVGGSIAGLERLCEDVNAEVRAVACWSRCLVDSVGAASWLRARLARNADPFLARALGFFGGREDVAALLDLESKAESPARAAALRALGDLGWCEALPRIAKAFEADDPVGQAAADAWAVLTGEQEAEPPEASTEEGADAAATPRKRVPPNISQGPLEATHQTLRGTPFVSGDDMERIWRRSLLAPSDDLAWLRREVPDGFFTAEPRLDAVPGE